MLVHLLDVLRRIRKLHQEDNNQNIIQLKLSSIWDDEKEHLGGDQRWYKVKWHSLSGCGPTTAATILSHIAEYMPKCRALYSYGFPLTKHDFIEHMIEVREYVKPGIRGLTSKTYFANEIRKFGDIRNVALNTRLINNSYSTEDAYEQVKKAIDKNSPLALLILRNPHKELKEFRWHWMVIIGYKGENTIIVTTWGKIYELDFRKVWNHTKKNSSGIVEVTSS